MLTNAKKVIIYNSAGSDNRLGGIKSLFLEDDNHYIPNFGDETAETNVSTVFSTIMIVGVVLVVFLILVGGGKK